MTNDEELVTRNGFDYAYSQDFDFDVICDSCDAKGHARSCITAIVADMQKFRNIAKKDTIFQPVIFLEKKLEGIREHWIKHFTELVNLADGEYWKRTFDNYVKDKTDHLVNIKEEDNKEKKVNY